MSFAIPVLTYHGAHVLGNEYANNDHLALAADLEMVSALGWRVIALSRVVDAVEGGKAPEGKVLALTFDDGTDFDFVDLDHPAHGPQRSLINILRDFRDGGDARQPELHATSFVVVAPEARATMDRTCLAGTGWWNDSWWREAIDTGLFDIANHSGDHHHESIDADASERARGTFTSIDDFATAEAEIAQAAFHLRRVAPNPGDALFAYPYGESNAYLAEEYFPRQHARIGIRAAFVGDGGPVTPAADRWRLPRYIFRDHWRSPDGLARLLREIGRGAA
jgi:peptidoglycan/xylan/chitin deacetylase (PgdA/CDA1 family)